MLSKLKDGKGFTLIELMVVVAIIGIILAVAVPYYINYKRTACDTSAKSDVGNLKAALENLSTEMTESTCTTSSAGGPRLKTPADITWGGPGASTLISSLVNYYGWGGTSVKCDVRVSFGTAQDATGTTVQAFKASAYLGRRPDGEASANRFIYMIPAAGGSDLPMSRDDSSGWATYTTRNDTSMGCQ